MEQPRGYQRAAFEFALKQNTVVYLETGCGKTLISVLLIKEFVKCMRSKGGNNVVIFLAPTVQLVIQQAKVITVSTGFEVAELHGDKGVDSWSNALWNTCLKQYEVLVMTPQILLDALSRAYVDLAFVKLLIFDECHNAKGQHPYYRIMREYYDKCEKKPKIFGMTASPLMKSFASSREDCEDQIAKLEYVFNSKVYTSENRHELEPYLPCPKETTMHYDRHFFDFKELKDILASLTEKHKRYSHDTCSLNLEFKDHEEYIKSLHKQLNSVHGNIEYCLDNFGIYCAFKATEFYKSKSTIDFDTELDHQALGTIQQNKNKLLEDMSVILFSALPTGYDRCQWTDGENSFEVDNNLISQKVHLLLRCLSSNRISKQASCIIFVERVISAFLISSLISELDCLKHISSEHMTGKTGLRADLSSRNKQSTLARFHSGEINVLVATNVAEEGIDVKSCSCIIQFDFPKHTNSFLQSRGRLRKANSEYIIFTERNNLKEQEMLLNFIDSYQMVVNVVLNRSTRMFSPNTVQKDDIDAYHVVKTGATINSHSSVNYIYKYCSKLPRDEYYRPQPEFEYINDGKDESWKCILRLPVHAPFQLAIASADSRKKAKRLACLEACRKLHAIGEIDEHLHQLIMVYKSNNDIVGAHHDIVGAEMTKKLRTGTTKQKELHSSTKAKAFSGDWLHKRGDVSFYAYKLIFEGWESYRYQNFLLLTETKLGNNISDVEIDLYLSCGEINRVHVISNGRLSLSSSQVTDAKTFQEILFNGMFHKLVSRHRSANSIVLKSIYETDEANMRWLPDNLYLLLPLEAGSSDGLSIEWKSINQSANIAKFFQASDARTRNGPEESGGIYLACGQVREEDLIGNAIITTHTGKIYCVTNVLHNKTAESLFSARDKTYFTTFTEYFQKKYGVKMQHKDQPVLQLKQKGRIQNLLRQFEYKGKQGKHEAYVPTYIEIPPELCLELQASNSMIDTLYLIPSVMHRLTTLGLASQLQQEIQEHSKCPTIPASLVMQALTTTRCLETFSSESLELLGDSILKYAVSCHLFLKYYNKHEGYLSAHRSEVVSNAKLHELARTRNLPEYIRDEPFDPLRWVAPGKIRSRVCHCRCSEMGKERIENGEIVVKIGRACDEGHRWMCSKTVSDCVEALIGAYMVGGGLNGAYEFMKWMNIDVSLELSTLKFPSVHPNILKGTDLTALESLLGYAFCNKVLLVDAITHASKQDLEGNYCYQRLEFLGDALLDFLITRHLYVENKDLSPGCLTDLRQAAVNNKTFAHTAVKHGLQKYLRHSSRMLSAQIREFVQSSEHGNSPLLQGEVDAPKVLGDVVESIAGAILVDSSFKLEKVWEILKPLLSPIVTPRTMHLDPVREVCEICNSYGFLWKWKESIHADKKMLFMEVSTHCTVIVGKSTKLNRKYGRKEAAQQILEQMEKKGIYHPYRQKVEQSNIITVQNAHDKDYGHNNSKRNAEKAHLVHCHKQTVNTKRNCNDNGKAEVRNACVSEGRNVLPIQKNYADTLLGGVHPNIHQGIRPIQQDNVDITFNAHKETEVDNNQANMNVGLTENIQLADPDMDITSASSNKTEGVADPIMNHQQYHNGASNSMWMGKGEARSHLNEYCMKRRLLNPDFKVELTKSNPVRFFSHVTLQVSTGEKISISGDERSDKNGARDSAAMLMLMELARRGLYTLKP